MQERDRFVDVMLREEVRRLNAHLPRNRKPLRDLLGEDAPSVQSVGGEEIRLKRNELDKLSSFLPGETKERIRLPLVLFRRTELGPGAYTVLGDPYEEYAIALLAESFKGTFQEFTRQKADPVVFYKSQISELLRKFHLLIVLGFGLTD